MDLNALLSEKFIVIEQGMPVPGTRPGMPEILLARARPKLDFKIWVVKFEKKNPLIFNSGEKVSYVQHLCQNRSHSYIQCHKHKCDKN